MICRVFVEKKEEYAVEAGKIFDDIMTVLHPEGLTGLRLLNLYDIEGLDQTTFDKVKKTILSEPVLDNIYNEIPDIPSPHRIFSVEYLPGQYDQRADSAAQCIQLVTLGERPLVRTARVYILLGNISDQDYERIQSYLINPVESRRASLEKPSTLKQNHPQPEKIEILHGFINLDKNQLQDFLTEYSLAMDINDLEFCQNYFKNTEKRDPTLTEIRVIDTYWSDHCRHTTFLTHINDINIHSDEIKKSFDKYTRIREELYQSDSRPVTLMDIATIGAKYLKKKGLLKDLDESEEINACSVKIKVDVDGEEQDWLLMFKNETHNHPTEIEPFGGAATCLGGAIRDPLSGRTYVYQAMRVTGSADPRKPIEQTRKGKLSQKRITVTAAQGYSSYGNQVGLATGLVNEIYHEGYEAKRMEIGAVIAAAPSKNVVRETPAEGDIVILLGGRTGRDGCGGATGSSKSHTLDSLESCGAEVQKGNPLEERKIQRLFRNSEVTRLIKKCNDFGAGGVSVAIGELADGLEIDLDSVPKKYDGLDGTELAISESQERMAVVIAQKDYDKFIEYAKSENLEATRVAVVTSDYRLRMKWNGDYIVDISRDFLNSNGAAKETDIEVAAPDYKAGREEIKDLKSKWYKTISDINIASQKGLTERFDSTIGASTVLMPYGGKHQLSPIQAMAAKIPLTKGETDSCSLMSYGYNPFISTKSPYHGAMLAVVESVSKIIAAGGSRKKCWLTLQEYFEKTNNDPKRFGKPFAALLGALEAELALGIGAIGGKDSMSGSFEELDVPPTLVSFAVSVSNASKIESTDFKKSGSKVVLLIPKYTDKYTPDFESLKDIYEKTEKLIRDKKVLSSWTIGMGGIAEGITKMTLGNHIGFEFSDDFTAAPGYEYLFEPCYGGFILELAEELNEGVTLGYTSKEPVIKLGETKLSLEELKEEWIKPLEEIFPSRIATENLPLRNELYKNSVKIMPGQKYAKPRVLIPVFPGTNCEYDTAKQFERVGGYPVTFIVKNLTSKDIELSAKHMAEQIRQSQIIMIPGGFSGGDEPEGSAKFIASLFRNEWIKEAVNDLLNNRDGLMLGICNGFQALIKLGLVPFGEIRVTDESCPTLTFNSIGRHQSKIVHTRITSNKSPWLYGCEAGEIYAIPISSGEGRFVASDSMIDQLFKNGQVATQYVDFDGNPTMDIRFNPNGSMQAIEGITSPDGRILGKMAHSERFGDNVIKNVYGNKDQKIFESGIRYFK